MKSTNKSNFPFESTEKKRILLKKWNVATSEKEVEQKVAKERETVASSISIYIYVYWVYDLFFCFYGDI